MIIGFPFTSINCFGIPAPILAPLPPAKIIAIFFIFETPVISKDGKIIDDIPPRATFYTAQAPQCFYLDEVIEAHKKIREINPSYNGIVDTCTLMRNLGKEVYIVDGPRGNIKVTTPEDLYTFRAMIQYQETEQIFGFARKEVAGRLIK